MDLSIFATPEAWISLVTLMFLEIVLGVDNLVFIVLTSDRLPPEKQHIGRKLGLLGALVSRVVFLCFASFLVHMTDKLFTIPGLYINGAEFGLSVRDLVLFLGGLYLIYKGIVELRDVLKLSEEKESQGDADKPRKTIGLAGAVATIMVMDIVFSIDSVITAVGLANHLIVMIIAVMLAKKVGGLEIYRGREIRIDAEPAMRIEYDGEPTEVTTPIIARSLPGSVRFVVSDECYKHFSHEQ